MRNPMILAGVGLLAVLLAVSLLSISSPPMVSADDDHGDYRSLATPLGIGAGEVNGIIDDTALFFDVDYFAFESRRGVEYTFTLNLTGVADANITVIDSDERGSGVAEGQEITWVGDEKQVQWVARTADTYFLEVYGAQGAPDGPVFLGAYTLRATADVTLEDRHEEYLTGATPIAIGNQYQGAVSPWPNQPMYPGSVQRDYDRDYFSFRANRGVKYTVSIELGSAQGVEISVSNEAGLVEASNDGLGPALEWIAPSTAIYYAVISGSSLVRQPVGTYTLEITADLALEDRHSGDRQSATPVSFGTQHQGAISPADDNDYFSFQAVRGVRYSFQANPTTTEGVGILVSDPAGNSEATNGGAGPDLDWVAPSTAIYYVVISGSPLVREPVGAYTLEVMADMTLEDRHSESREGATQISLGNAHIGSISPVDDVDHFFFQAIRGVRYTFQAGMGTSTGVSLSVLNPTEGVAVTTSGVGDQLEWIAPTTETYYATVTGSNRVNDPVGTYTLEVTADASLEDRHSDVREGATTVRLGSAQDGAISPDDDQDYFFFRAVRGVEYEILVTPAAMAGIGIAIAQPAEGIELSNSGSGNTLSWIAPADDTYYVAISASPQIMDPIGTYSLQVNANTSLQDQHSESREGATPLGFGTVYNGAVSPHDDLDFFSFPAKRGMMYSIDAGSGGGAAVSIAVGRPVEGSVLSNEGAGSQLEWIATEDGTYFVILSGSARVNDAVGNYSLTVNADSALEDRHSDQTESATPISFGSSVAGAISPEEDRDHFSFTALRGVKYTFELDYGTAESVNLSVLPLDGAQAPVAANYGEESGITWVAEESGSYIVTVTASPHAIERVGTYFLRVDADSSLEDRHSDSLTNATEIDFGNNIGGAVSPVDDQDNFTFEAEKGRTYLVLVDTDNEDPFRFIVTNAESGFTDSNYGTGELLSVTAPLTGVFYVTVSAARSDNAALGSYEITVTPDNLAPTINPPQDGQTFNMRSAASEMVLEAGTRVAPPGTTVRVPIMVEQAEDVVGVTFSLSYDPEVVEVIGVTKGAAFPPATFRYHADDPGVIRFGFASDGPLAGGGSAAVVEFRAVGELGSSTELTLSRSLVSDTFSRPLTIALEDGLLTVQQRITGDGDGDGAITALDGLIALRMAAQTLAEDLALDIDGDGAVTVEDARQILALAGPERGI